MRSMRAGARIAAKNDEKSHPQQTMFIFFFFVVAAERIFLKQRINAYVY